MGLPTSPRLASELQEPAATRRAVAPAPPATFLDGGPLLPARVTTVSWLALPASCGALLHLRMAAEAPAAVVPALIGPLAGCSCCSAAGLLRQVNRWKLAIGGSWQSVEQAVCGRLEKLRARGEVLLPSLCPDRSYLFVKAVPAANDRLLVDGLS